MKKKTEMKKNRNEKKQKMKKKKKVIKLRWMEWIQKVRFNQIVELIILESFLKYTSFGWRLNLSSWNVLLVLKLWVHLSSVDVAKWKKCFLRTSFSVKGLEKRIKSVSNSSCGLLYLMALTPWQVVSSLSSSLKY